ncbi:MarR family winged helix-turn-helix transcriptional regulator [Ensifer soli]|uniref:MarR family winged helix-turn-helix transcriptional regulator n=1 Tax=Ciceribacter sp. sgz301302 TaxID=3342379 RepID=UPI0035B866E0
MATDEEIAPLTRHTGYWLRLVSNHVSQAFARRVEERGVTVAEWVVLRDLFDHGALAPGHLAVKIGWTRGAISKLADRLLAKGLIHRQADPQDGRGQILSLTAAGRALVPDLARCADENDAAFFGHLTVEDRQLLDRLLKDLSARHGPNATPVD